MMYLRLLANRAHAGTIKRGRTASEIDPIYPAGGLPNDELLNHAVRRWHLGSKFEMFQDYESRLDMVDQEICSGVNTLL
jgi:hypothetical protein